MKESNTKKSRLQMYVTGHYACSIAFPCNYQLLVEPDVVTIIVEMFKAAQDYSANL